MTLKELVPWRWGSLRHGHEDERPYGTFLEELETLHKQMDRLFEDFWEGSRSREFMKQPWALSDLTPRIDQSEDDKGFHVRIELPGMDEEDVDVSLADGMLVIRGEKKREKEEKGKEFHRSERMFGTFRRTIPLPVDVDESQITADFEKGILTIELPKSEEALAKVRHIPIKAA